MGIIRNVVFKTAIKKALLDVTEQIETLAKQMRQASSFGESVMTYSRHNQFDDELKAETWEATFAKIVAMRAQSEMPSSYLIQNQRELVVFISLVAEWVALRGGNVANIDREFPQDV